MESSVKLCEIGKLEKDMLEPFIELLWWLKKAKTLKQYEEISLKMLHSSHGYIYLSERFNVTKEISHENRY